MTPYHAEAVALDRAIRQAPYSEKLYLLEALSALLVRMTAPEACAEPAPAPAPTPPGDPRLRKAQRLRRAGNSQEAIATALGVSRRTVRGWLEEKP